MTPLEMTPREMTFSEAIKVLDGEFRNLPLHEERMNRTARHFFGREFELRPAVPPQYRAGLVKCRVVYGADGIRSVEFAPYVFRKIAAVAVVRDDTIDYTWKSTDRSLLNALLASSGCDEIIIVKNGLVTDTSSANIVIEDASGELHTSSTPLLRGTKRESLLRAGTIREREIRPEELLIGIKIRLINAMIDLEDGVVTGPIERF